MRLTRTSAQAKDPVKGCVQFCKDINLYLTDVMQLDMICEIEFKMESLISGYLSPITK